MSTGSTTTEEQPAVAAPGPTSDIIRQGIANLQAHNETANAELNETLQDLRHNLAAGAGVPIRTGVPLPTATEGFQRERLELTASQWASEVIAAGALDDTFKEEVGQRARAILADNDMIPADSSSEPET